MRVSRLFLDQPLQADALLRVEGPAAHYLLTVLRLPSGAALRVFDGRGGEFEATLAEAGKKHALLQLGAATGHDAESPLCSHLGLGISRGERMDYAIQKATELGVSSIAPLFSEHCEVRLAGERADKRQAHWRQVAISACEQSGRTRVPEILAPQPLSTWLAAPPCPLRLVFDQRQAQAVASLPPSREVALLVGPEGGLSEKEIDAARAAGFIGIALGPRVLRTETAPLAALAVLQYLWGDFGTASL